MTLVILDLQLGPVTLQHQSYIKFRDIGFFSLKMISSELYLVLKLLTPESKLKTLFCESLLYLSRLLVI